MHTRQRKLPLWNYTYTRSFAVPRKEGSWEKEESQKFTPRANFQERAAAAMVASSESEREREAAWAI
jgi:hypothetical protein